MTAMLYKNCLLDRVILLLVWKRDVPRASAERVTDASLLVALASSNLHRQQQQISKSPCLTASGVAEMSTFDGVVKEFPDIRIDYFRQSSERPPLAYLLSHVHTDHLQGLDTCKSPFIYCSPATREILLRLEKYPYVYRWP